MDRKHFFSIGFKSKVPPYRLVNWLVIVQLAGCSFFPMTSICGSPFDAIGEKNTGFLPKLREGYNMCPFHHTPHTFLPPPPPQTPLLLSYHPTIVFSPSLSVCNNNHNKQNIPVVQDLQFYFDYYDYYYYYYYCHVENEENV